jgi:hypothetical protein
MISWELHTLFLSATVCLVAVLLVYDAVRVLRPRIPGERQWRRWRVLGTTAAIVALMPLQRPVGGWFRWTAALTLLLALVFVLRCSVSLKRLVSTSLLYRREHP